MGPMRASISAVVVAAFWALAAVGATMLPMTDPDTWWHIRVGREILESGTIPRVDEWSIAGGGRPWVSQDWASNVLLAGLHGVGGVTAVSVAYGLMALAAVGLLWNAIGVRNDSIGWLARSAWLLFGLVLAAPVLGPRVQVVDLLLAAAALNVLWRFLAAPVPWHLVALPAIAVAWVNLHAGFPLLFLLGGAVAGGELVDRWLGRPAVARHRLALLSASLATALIVLALNPNALAIYSYPFETLAIGALGSFIGEWQPARLTAPAGQLLTVFIVVGVLPALLLAPGRLRTSDGLILVGLVYMAVTAVRFLLVAGPIGAAVVCLAVAPAISASPIGRGSAAVLRRMHRAPRQPASAINTALVGIVVLAGLGVAWARVGPDGQRGAIADAMPVAAVEWLELHDPGERIFNRYEWGGYLGFHRPDELVFIDGRADVYGDSVIRGYVETTSVRGDPASYFHEHAIDHVLYPPDSTLGRWLSESDAWRLVYVDAVAGIWVRD